MSWVWGQCNDIYISHNWHYGWSSATYDEVNFMGKFIVQAGVKKEKHKNSKKKERYQRQRWWSWANIWSRKIPGKWRCAGHSVPSSPLLLPKAASTPIGNIIVICHHKNRGKPFLLVYIVMQNETFFCNELDQTVCFMGIKTEWNGQRRQSWLISNLY